MRLYYNARCSKSRAALRLLEDAGHAPDIVDYLARPPDRETIERLVDTLDEAPAALVRTRDTAFVEHECPGADLGRERVVAILLAAPQLLQRPLLETNGRTLVARPPARVFELVGKAADMRR